MHNKMTHWIEDNTQFGGYDTSARLALLITKEPDMIRD